MYAIGNQAYTNMQLMTKKNCANPDIVQIQIQVGQISELSKYCNRANNALSLLNLNLDFDITRVLSFDCSPHSVMFFSIY